MIGWIRTLLAFAIVAVATPLLVLWQAAARAAGMSDKAPPRLWHRMAVSLLGLRIHVHGRMATERPLLIAANHISWTDIMVIGSVADVHFIAKSELARWPIMGPLARYERTVFVERDNRRKSAEQAGEIAARLAAGDAMVLFAEGTTHDGNVMQQFKSTLFAAASMAIEAGPAERIFVQPVAIAYTRLHGLPMGRHHRVHAAWIGDSDLLPHILALLREGAVDVELHFGEPVAFAAGASRKLIAARIEDEVRKMMHAALARPRPSKDLSPSPKRR